MFLGNAAFGGSATTAGQWIDSRPSFDASIDVWKQALAMAYNHQGIGPDGIGAALAERYLFDSELPEWVIKTVSEFASSIAQISNKISVETVLNGVEYAINNIPNGGLDVPGNYGAWRAATIASIYQPPKYPIDYSVFGNDAAAAHDFVVHTVAASKPLTTVKTGDAFSQGTIKTGSTVAPAVIQKTPVSVQQYLEPVNEGGGLKLAAVVAAIASFLI